MVIKFRRAPSKAPSPSNSQGAQNTPGQNSVKYRSWYFATFLDSRYEFFSGFSSSVLVLLKTRRKLKTCNAVTVTCVLLFRTGLLMICYLRLGILLSKEGFIFLDLVHQRKRAIMPFVRLENVTSINDAFNFY